MGIIYIISEETNCNLPMYKLLMSNFLSI